jgi:hypothetical protein
MRAYEMPAPGIIGAITGQRFPENLLMGAWGSGSLDNDDAADFVADLVGLPAAGRVQRVRAALMLPDSYLQVDDANVAVAAAALVAASNGMSLPGPAEVEGLIQSGTIPPDSQVCALARAALERVNGENSEWHDLWAEAGSLAEAVGVLNSIQLHL